jgi:hypothetical protein
MKKNVLLIVAATLTIGLSSCSKSDSSPSTYLKAKINGNWVTFNNALSELGPDLGDPSKIDLGVSATNSAGSEILDFAIQSDSQIGVGTYASDDPRYFITMSYLKNANVDPIDYDISDVSNRPSSRYTITITSITDKEIRGTFTGNYLSEFITENVQEVTEGEFAAPRIR